MAQNPLVELASHGQSIWLDYISRDLLSTGVLEALIAEDQVKGVTSNPSIFEKAIGKSSDYDHAIANLRQQKNGHKADAVYEQIAIKEIQTACDLLRPVYDENGGRDGFASLEVSPILAHDTQESIEEAERLWREVNRPNLMIKIPGTKAGAGAIRALIAEGINVNVTLLFSVDSYEEAAMAYLHGLQEHSRRGFPIDNVHSVASFFVSRIDSKVDKELERIANHATESATKKRANALMGTIAIANAKLAYERFAAIWQSDLAQSLARLGANPQRLLWASTSTKNPQYSDVLYVEALIGPHTVNTLPVETLEAFRDHGKVATTLSEGLAESRAAMNGLKSLGIDFNAVCEDLQTEGVELFEKAFDHLLKAVEQKIKY